jgi:dTDP-4-dehydrorhamnose 3,5-epimerase
MTFIEIPLKGAYIISPDRKEDERGFFARTFCKNDFSQHGLNPNLAQCSISFNKVRGTLRGMHYQIRPHEETKIVRCTMGSVFDVIIDLRPDSSDFKKWFSIELNSNNRLMLYVPEGFAHGFLTLEDNTEVLYEISEFYAPDTARGVRWNDPAFGIIWPESPKVISIKDREYADFVK